MNNLHLNAQIPRKAPNEPLWILSLETNFQGPEMCSVISTLSDLKPCRTRQWQLRQFNRSQKPQDPKYPIPNLKRASCNDRFLTADDSLLPLLQRVLSMNQLVRTRASLHTDRYGLSIPRASPWA